MGCNPKFLLHFVRTQSIIRMSKIIIAVDCAANKYIKYRRFAGFQLQYDPNCIQLYFSAISINKSKYSNELPLLYKRWPSLALRWILSDLNLHTLVLQVNSLLLLLEALSSSLKVVAARLPTVTSSQSVQVLANCSSTLLHFCILHLYTNDSTCHFHCIPQAASMLKLFIPDTDSYWNVSQMRRKEMVPRGPFVRSKASVHSALNLGLVKGFVFLSGRVKSKGMIEPVIKFLVLICYSHRLSTNYSRQRLTGYKAVTLHYDHATTTLKQKSIQLSVVQTYVEKVPGCSTNADNFPWTLICIQPMMYISQTSYLQSAGLEMQTFPSSCNQPDRIHNPRELSCLDLPKPLYQHSLHNQVPLKHQVISSMEGDTGHPTSQPLFLDVWKNKNKNENTFLLVGQIRSSFFFFFFVYKKKKIISILVDLKVLQKYLYSFFFIFHLKEIEQKLTCLEGQQCVHHEYSVFMSTDWEIELSEFPSGLVCPFPMVPNSTEEDTTSPMKAAGSASPLHAAHRNKQEIQRKSCGQRQAILHRFQRHLRVSCLLSAMHKGIHDHSSDSYLLPHLISCIDSIQELSSFSHHNHRLRMADLRGLKTSIQKHATLWCARIATVRGVACYIGFSGGGFSKTKWEWGALQHSEKPGRKRASGRGGLLVFSRLTHGHGERLTSSAGLVGTIRDAEDMFIRALQAARSTRLAIHTHTQQKREKQKKMKHTSRRIALTRCSKQKQIKDRIFRDDKGCWWMEYQGL
ncbi:hypothetical protein VP01_658g2 [Puccinia sorghi]|uniref:Uncharacterized protein n=1 Tax=Puccinia sorghi TaxID=27349 RepID=A0A0L6UF70_9BASI|nr:hypothetical protein VP01_658g2 [Puccinia sorghi]